MVNKRRIKYKMCTKYILCSTLRFLGAKLRKATTSFLMSIRLSVRPHGTTLLPLDGISCDLVFEHFSNISLEKRGPR